MLALVAILLGTVSVGAFANGVAKGDKGYIQETFGIRIIPFMYLGARHMVTRYDHLLCLLGVILPLPALGHWRVRYAVCRRSFHDAAVRRADRCQFLRH